VTGRWREQENYLPSCIAHATSLSPSQYRMREKTIEASNNHRHRCGYLAEKFLQVFYRLFVRFHIWSIEQIVRFSCFIHSDFEICSSTPLYSPHKSMSLTSPSSKSMSSLSMTFRFTFLPSSNLTHQSKQSLSVQLCHLQDSFDGFDYDGMGYSIMLFHGREQFNALL
jgi:hypothetical protein